MYSVTSNASYLVHGLADSQLVYSHLTVLVRQLLYLVPGALEELLQKQLKIKVFNKMTQIHCKPVH